MPLEHFRVQNFGNDLQMLEAPRSGVKELPAVNEYLLRFKLHLGRFEEQREMAEKIVLLGRKGDSANQLQIIFLDILFQFD